MRAKALRRVLPICCSNGAQKFERLFAEHDKMLEEEAAIKEARSSGSPPTMSPNCRTARLAEPVQSSRMATARIHPALARSILTGKQLTMKPCGGSAARFASFSIWGGGVIGPDSPSLVALPR